MPPGWEVPSDNLNNSINKHNNNNQKKQQKNKKNKMLDVYEGDEFHFVTAGTKGELRVSHPADVAESSS